MNLENVMKTIDELNQHFDIDIKDIDHNDHHPSVLYNTNKYRFIELYYRAYFVPNKPEADAMSKKEFINEMYASEADITTIDDYLDNIPNNDIHYVFDIAVQTIGGVTIHTFTSNNVDEMVLDITDHLNELKEVE